MERTYTVVVLHERDGRYSAVAPALECASWGHTVPEALKMVAEAIQLHVESLEAHADDVPEDTSLFMLDMGDALDAVIYRVAVPTAEVAAIA